VVKAMGLNSKSNSWHQWRFGGQLLFPPSSKDKRTKQSIKPRLGGATVDCATAVESVLGKANRHLNNKRSARRRKCGDGYVEKRRTPDALKSQNLARVQRTARPLPPAAGAHRGEMRHKERPHFCVRQPRELIITGKEASSMI